MIRVFRKACPVVSPAKYTGKNGEYLRRTCLMAGVLGIELDAIMPIVVIHLPDPLRGTRAVNLHPGQYLVQYDSGALGIMEGSAFEEIYEFVDIRDAKATENLRLREELLFEENKSLKKKVATLLEGPAE